MSKASCCWGVNVWACAGRTAPSASAKITAAHQAVPKCEARRRAADRGFTAMQARAFGMAISQIALDSRGARPDAGRLTAHYGTFRRCRQCGLSANGEAAG